MVIACVRSLSIYTEPCGNDFRTTYKEEIMILRLSLQVLEDALLPVPFHQVPVINRPMANRVVNGVRFGVRDGFVADEEV